jgi:hypothetical protein
LNTSKVAKFLPTRFCLKKIGPLESILINSAMSIKNGKHSKQKKPLTKKSMLRFM